MSEEYTLSEEAVWIISRKIYGGVQPDFRF